MNVDHELPFDAVVVDPASPPDLDDQLSTPDRHWETTTTDTKKCPNFVYKLTVGFVVLVATLGTFYYYYWNPSNNMEDTRPPSSRIDSRREMESIVLEISDPATLFDPHSAQSKALDWLVDQETRIVKDGFLQRYALMVFFFSTNGDRWTMLEPWDEYGVGMHECQFSGIDCDPEKHVVVLSLMARRLSGTIPQELGILSHLESLLLGRNEIQGSIPAYIFRGCERLMDLDLAFNPLSSTISTDIGNLFNLRRLKLSSTNLSGSLPESLKTLRTLSMVDLSRTNLEGPIFDFVLSWPNIQTLSIGQSPFFGTVPTEIGDLQLLTGLVLDGTSINTTLPTEIGKLTNLDILRIGALTAHGGSIPSEIGNLKKLDHLMIEGKLFTGKLPSEIGRLSDLTYMRISGGLLTGTVPSEIALLKALETLDLSRNELRGDIPAAIGDLERLSKFAMHFNNFEGRLPGTLCSIQTIFYDCSVACDCCACTCLACYEI